MQNKIRKQLTQSILIVMTLLPFAQVGVSYYMSVQLFIFLVMVLFVTFEGIKRNLLITILLFFLMFMQYLQANIHCDGSTLARTLREFICLSFLLVIFDGRYAINLRRSQQIEKIIVVLSVVILVTIVVQQIGIGFGKLLFMPEKWMATNANTLPNALELRFIPEHIRPSALWGEPSYVGFIALSVMVMAFHSLQNGKKLRIVIVMLLLSVLIARTLSGLISIIIILVLHYNAYLKNKASFYKRPLLIIMSIVLTIVLGFYSFVVTVDELPWWLARIISIPAGGDYSGNIRLLAPFKLITYVFSKYPLGLPLNQIPTYFWYTDGKTAIDNGLLNLFIEFGFVGFAIFIIMILKIFRNSVILLYVLFSAMFNGSFLAVDKVSIIALVFVVYNAVLIVNQQKNNDLVVDI